MVGLTRSGLLLKPQGLCSSHWDPGPARGSPEPFRPLGLREGRPCFGAGRLSESRLRQARAAASVAHRRPGARVLEHGLQQDRVRAPGLQGHPVE